MGFRICECVSPSVFQAIFWDGGSGGGGGGGGVFLMSEQTTFTHSKI